MGQSISMFDIILFRFYQTHLEKYYFNIFHKPVHELFTKTYYNNSNFAKILNFDHNFDMGHGISKFDTFLDRFYHFREVLYRDIFSSDAPFRSYSSFSHSVQVT